MKKEYELINAEIIRFNTADVLATSSTSSDSEKENSYIDAGDLFTTEPGGWF